MPQDYTKVLEHKGNIMERIAEGKTQREIAQEFGFKDKYVVKRFLHRERRREAKQQAGILPKVLKAKQR